jgi:hypothetical protein
LAIAVRLHVIVNIFNCLGYAYPPVGAGVDLFLLQGPSAHGGGGEAML